VESTSNAAVNLNVWVKVIVKVKATSQAQA
jgi:hypothetical protein